MFKSISISTVKSFLDGINLDDICTRGKSVINMRNEIERLYGDTFYAINGIHIFDYFENTDLLDYVARRYGFSFYQIHDYISG